MLSKNSIKTINSLRIKKYRNEKRVFIAEGERLIEEILNSTLITEAIYSTSNWQFNHSQLNIESIEVTEVEMNKISGLSSPSNVFALVKIPEYDIPKKDFNNTLVLALDDIQDPGNLGTIIRLADWFGIDYLICSQGTVDAFSPKVVQASMGAISRVKIIYCDLQKTLTEHSKFTPIYGTFMSGVDIYDTELTSKGIIVMGNEGNGICPEIEKLITKKIHIPTFATNRISVESLNVAMATAIVCSEFKRRG